MKADAVRISAEVKCRVRFLRELTQQGVKATDIINEPEKPLKFSVKSSDRKKTFAILKKLCYNYSVERDCGFRALLNLVKTKIAAAAGFALAAAVCAFLSQCVFFVRIVGTEHADENAVKAVVLASAELPSLASSLDTETIKRKVMSMDGIAMCEAAVRGNSIIVRVVGASAGEQRPSGGKITAVSDAIVTRVIVRKGTALKKPGDIVKKGDTLIGGEIFSSDESHTVQVVVPDGEVWGKVVYRAYAVIPDEKIVKRRTGKTERFSFVTFGGYKPVHSSSFDSFDREISVRKFSLLLPLKYTVATYYETVFEYVKTDIQSEADKLLDGINASAAGTLLQTKVFTRRLDGGCTEVRVYAVYESKISP